MNARFTIYSDYYTYINMKINNSKCIKKSNVNLLMVIVVEAIEFSAIDGDEYADIHQKICAFKGKIVLFFNNIIAKHVCFDCNVELTHKMDPLYTNKLSDAILMEIAIEINYNYFHYNGSSKFTQIMALSSYYFYHLKLLQL